MPDRMSGYMSERMSACMPDRMPDRLSECLSHRMPNRECTNKSQVVNHLDCHMYIYIFISDRMSELCQIEWQVACQNNAR